MKVLIHAVVLAIVAVLLALPLTAQTAAAKPDRPAPTVTAPLPLDSTAADKFENLSLQIQLARKSIENAQLQYQVLVTGICRQYNIDITECQVSQDPQSNRWMVARQGPPPAAPAAEPKAK